MNFIYFFQFQLSQAMKPLDHSRASDTDHGLYIYKLYLAPPKLVVQLKLSQNNHLIQKQFQNILKSQTQANNALLVKSFGIIRLNTNISKRMHCKNRLKLWHPKSNKKITYFSTQEYKTRIKLKTLIAKN